MMNPNVQLDSLEFLKKSFNDILDVVEGAYDSYDNFRGEDEGHTALQSIKAKVTILKNFTEAVYQVKSEPKETE